MTYLTRTKHLLRDLEVVECSIPEIVDLEKELSIFLPEAYREFLLWMGKDTGKFLQGSEVTYKHLVKIQGWANELLEERELPLLPKDAFVFYIHQGYQFAYFLLNREYDPKVYFFDECITKGVELLRKSYSEWLTTEAEIFYQYQRAENYEEN
jgi:hypothetical protein